MKLIIFDKMTYCCSTGINNICAYFKVKENKKHKTLFLLIPIGKRYGRVKLSIFFFLVFVMNSDSGVRVHDEPGNGIFPSCCVSLLSRLLFLSSAGVSFLIFSFFLVSIAPYPYYS